VIFWNFFLKGYYDIAKQATDTIKQINALFVQNLQKIANLGRARFSCEVVLEYIKILPQVTVSLLATELRMTAPTARSALNHMMRIGVIEEISSNQRDKVCISQVSKYS